MRERNVTTRQEQTPAVARRRADAEPVNFASDMRLLGMGLTLSAALHASGFRGVYIALTVLVLPLLMFVLDGYIAGRAGMVGTLAMSMGVALLASPSPLDVGPHGATPELLVLSVVGMLAMMGSSWADDLRPASEDLARKSFRREEPYNRWSRIEVHAEESNAVAGPYGLGGRSFRLDMEEYGPGGRPARRELDRVDSMRSGRERRDGY